jgi:hypothetical protein
VAGALPLFILASGHFVKLAFGAASVVLMAAARTIRASPRMVVRYNCGNKAYSE